MKFLCPSCERLADISTFRVEGPVLVLSCDRCGVESRSAPARAEVESAARQEPEELAAPAAIAAPAAPVRVPPLWPGAMASAGRAAEAGESFAVPSGHCPKCVAPRRNGAVSCPSCGLVFANFRPEEHRPSPWLERAWRELLTVWEEHDAHERFVQEASLHDELVAAGRLYRLRLARFAEDRMALHGRDALLKLASTPALTPETGRPPERRVGLGMAVLVIMLLAAAAMLFLFRRMLIPAQ